ncbi:DCN1 [Candida oxycetoniae]|uniref:Defective in cullin neddylation protein n=1 Tax=Candida oxycetoniae TaxID=497107 RepID=A0AAI9WWD2_9ASCO|nr:DCN1 [Candida oxycetoniae]KAI3402828.2 DCN1 [Candida oxycetoniae]
MMNQFCELTGTSITTAGRYLESGNYDIARAVDLYYSKHPGEKHDSVDPKLVAIFDSYKDSNNPDIIDIDGTIRYLEDLKIDPDDPKSLTLAFLLKAPKVGEFQRDSFINSWQFYNITSLKEMSQFVANFHRDILQGVNLKDIDGEPVTFKRLYNFTFRFLLEAENQKVLDVALAVSYWQLLLPLVPGFPNGNESLRSKINERISNWFDYLNAKPKKVISFDTWSMFLPFFQEVIITDPYKLSNYDEMAAWPSKIDEYVEYLYDNNFLS